MRKILAFIFLCLSFTFTSAWAVNFNQIVFFGDSLSDNGNLYQFLFHVLPKSPPYYQGRFSNGEVWSETLAKYYYEHYYTDAKFYAVGGATAVFHMPSTKFISPATLEVEVDKYLVDSIFRDKSKVLYIIWIGGNDYLYDQTQDLNQATSNVVDRITWAIELLKRYGGKNFLVLNLPDLSHTPMAIAQGETDKLHAMSLLHNKKLDAAVTNLQLQYSDISIGMVDTYFLFNDVVNHPEKYNRKYNTMITDTTTACWQGGYMYKNSLTAESISKEIEVSLRQKGAPADFDVQSASQYIASSPTLLNAYHLGKAYEQGILPCANPNNHLFWDSIHPTQAVHTVLARIVIDKIGK